jgi:hypothetical protein
MVLALLAIMPTAMLAQAAPAKQTAASTAPERGYLAYIDFGGSANGDGRIFTLGFSGGYQFNRHVSVGARLPIYFVTATGLTNLSSGKTTLSSNGMGDPQLNLTLKFSGKHALAYQTGLTASLPATDTSNGFSTGDVLVDWTSRLSKRVGRLVPFARLDIANTVPDTPVFILPYTAQGFNARLEGGAEVMLTNIFSVGASVYGVLPSGQQHVYSRMVTSSNSGMSRMAQSRGGGNGFRMNPVTVGNDLTSDQGVSTWLTANLPNNIDLQAAYSRSYGYDLNTFTFGVGYDLGAALRHRHAKP